MKIQTISGKAARRLALHSQGLDSKWPFGKGKRGVKEAIQHLGYTQLDTISVVERAHHHVLWSRVPDYKKEYLHMLQVGDRAVFEYWAHAAAFLPMNDYRYALPIMRHFREHRDGWPKSNKHLKQEVLDRVRSEGPLMARDFKHHARKKGDGWWDWKPAKLALQRLFFEGELMIRERQAFQRVYDLPERILPPDIDKSEPGEREYVEYLVRSTIRSHGLAAPQAMGYQRKGMQGQIRKCVAELSDSGEIVPVRVRNAGQTVYYSTTSLLNHSEIRIRNSMRILSPFDNAVIQRQRVRNLFDYDYQIECYVPAPKRVFGYFCLPLLLGDRFVGRIDAKADRKKNVLHLKHIALEHRMDYGKFAQHLATALPEFMQFNQCDQVIVHKVTPKEIKGAVQMALGG